MLANFPKWRGWVLVLALAGGLPLAGCGKSKLRSQNPDDDDVKVPEAVFIADQVTVSGLHPIQVECVGIVTGLDGTGGDTPPSLYRTMAVDEMRKRGVKNPHSVLQSPNTALVIVRAALPPVIEIGDKFDVEVVLPENTSATSLRGGFLLECALSEQAMIPGRAPAKGHILGKAEGPIMLSTGEGDSASMAGVLKRGRVLGGEYRGGVLKKGREMGLYIRNDLKSFRQATRIATAIGKRFYSFERGIKKPLAEAKTDQYIQLKVHPKYKDNYIRYVQVIRHLALNESAVEQRERMERLRKTLLAPQTAAKSAMELEAIGPDSILVLKEGLQSPNAEVRFYSADALAYLGNSSGAKELAAAAREEAFRVFALAALATIDDPVTRELLRELMTEPTLERKNGESRETWSAETRYGAFRTLWTIDKYDEFIRGQRMNDGEYMLHVLNAPGEAMVHLTTYRVPEVVLFDGEQRFRTPLSLSAGRHIMVTAPAGSDTVRVTRYAVDEDDQELICGTRVADVIRTVSKLRASYPDVAQMLVQAERQSALSRLELDALPQAGRIYHRALAAAEAAAGEVATAAAAEEATRIGKPNLVPNLFPTVDGPGPSEDPSPADARPSDAPPPAAKPTAAASTTGAANDAGEASLADVREKPDESEPPAERKRGFLGLFRRP